MVYVREKREGRENELLVLQNDYLVIQERDNPEPDLPVLFASFAFFADNFWHSIICT
jgi:hypothetical protein